MSALSSKLRSAEGGGLLFWCPGCDAPHVVWHEPNGSRPTWKWNGDVDRPTFSPSLLVRWDQWEPPATDEAIATKIKSGEIVQSKVHKVCHSFIRDGQIQFLSDCTHELRGQNAPMPDWDDGDDDE